MKNLFKHLAFLTFFGAIIILLLTLAQIVTSGDITERSIHILILVNSYISIFIIIGLIIETIKENKR